MFSLYLCNITADTHQHGTDLADVHLCYQTHLDVLTVPVQHHSWYTSTWCRSSWCTPLLPNYIWMFLLSVWHWSRLASSTKWFDSDESKWCSLVTSGPKMKNADSSTGPEVDTQREGSVIMIRHVKCTQRFCWWCLCLFDGVWACLMVSVPVWWCLCLFDGVCACLMVSGPV